MWRAAVGIVCAAQIAGAHADVLTSLEAAAAGSHGDFGPCAPARLAPVASEAAIQFLPALGQLIAWRIVRGAAAPCIELDWPARYSLSAVQAHGLQQLLDQQDRAVMAAAGVHLPRAEIAPARLRAQRADWTPPTAPMAGSDAPSLPWCPRTGPPSAQIPVLLPDSVAPLLLRVRPHRCQPGSRPLAGSGVLLAPDLALTAAHVVLTSEGRVCDRYRVVPGGRRYTDPPAAPFGMAFVSRAYLSDRGGWLESATAAPPLDAEYAARTTHDFAFLMLDKAVRLPGNVRWPRVRFSAAPLPPGLRVLRAGYGSIGPEGRIAPGVAVNHFGHTACARTAEPFRRFALWMSPGASGGPIWHWPDAAAPFELLSLGVRMETHGDHQFETLGPRFDEIDYQRLLELLEQRRG